MSIVVGADNKAEQRRIQLGQSTSTVASVTSGLSLGEKVIVEGLQRVRPGRAGRAGAGERADPVEHECQSGGWQRPEKRRRNRAEAGGDDPMISSVFVDRPRLAIVIAFVITIAGALALLQIPVAQFPGYRAAAGDRHRQLSGRLRRGGGNRASPSRSRPRSSASTRCST